MKKTTILAGLLATALAAPARHVAAQDPEVASLVRGYNAAGLALFRTAWPADGNVVLSPYSIGAAMTMALAGARGETEAELAAALGAGGVLDRLDAVQRTAREQLMKSASGEGVQLRIANGLALAEHGDLIVPAFRDRVRDAYAAEIFPAPDVAAVNAWVEKETHGRIRDLLQKFPPNCVAVLLNAVWFKGLWEKPFDPDLTRPGPFRLDGGETIEVPTLQQSADFSVLRNDMMEAIALPYAGGDLVMIVLLPPPGKALGELERRLDAKTLEDTLAELKNKPAGRRRLSLPKFKMTVEAGLVPAFEKLGVHRAFSAEEADFGGMVGRDTAPGLIWISDILHKAFIEVNEEGSEAAAATAVIMVTRAMMEEDAFTVDRPALFLIVDQPTGAILFLGRLADPR